jgi:chromosomal replication initiation ATPase DnaA
LLEDADAAPKVENELFHLLNLVRESDTYLVVTARRWPDSWGLATRDLLSRLRLAPAIEIGEPDDALVRAVLVKLFVDRQLVVDTSVVEYLALRIERSLDAARAVVEELDREALALRRPITRPVAADVLRRLDGR